MVFLESYTIFFLGENILKVFAYRLPIPLIGVILLLLPSLYKLVMYSFVIRPLGVLSCYMKNSVMDIIMCYVKKVYNVTHIDVYIYVSFDCT